MESTSPSPDELARRKLWFERYVHDLEHNSVVREPERGVMYVCPCCRYRTLSERGAFLICPVCYWEDDGQDDQDADVVRGGPNGTLSLLQARANYQAFGACQRRVAGFVRDPLPHEQV
jgi:hypothetical protein